MATAEAVREEPIEPPVKEYVLTLTPEEAEGVSESLGQAGVQIAKQSPFSGQLRDALLPPTVW
jgi:hypothetical protein